MKSNIDKLQSIISNSDNIVFFGGAGVSTESGIPDFRSQDGLYNEKYEYPAEEILSFTFFKNNVEGFYEFYKAKMLYLDSKPNNAHKKLAELEESGKLKAVITQNVDGLHQKAGSKNVIEIHGSVYKNYCAECGKEYSAKFILNNPKKIPICECGGIIKPDVVLYGEKLNPQNIEDAIFYINNADTFIIGGTSLSVQPAANLIHYFEGKNLIIINNSPTKQDEHATLLIKDNIASVFEEIVI